MDVSGTSSSATPATTCWPSYHPGGSGCAGAIVNLSLDLSTTVSTADAAATRKSEHVLTSAIASSTCDNGRTHATRECASSKWSAKKRTMSPAPAPYASAIRQFLVASVLLPIVQSHQSTYSHITRNFPKNPNYVHIARTRRVSLP